MAMNPVAYYGAAISREWKGALFGILTGCLLVSLILWPTVLGLAALWRESVTYQFSWLVIPLLVYLLAWHHRQATALIRPQPDFTGVPVAIVAAVCWSASGLMNIEAGRQFALILALQGVVMSALGWRAYWRLFPSLALLFFLVPSGDLLLPALRFLTVKGMALFASVANLPHRVDGFVVWVGKNDYLVLSDCAGLPYFLLATFLGYAFGALLYHSFYKVIGFALLGSVIGILYNALRVNMIVAIDWINGTQMSLADHSTFHWIGLLLSLGLLFFVLSRLHEDETPMGQERAQPDAVSRLHQWGPVAAGLCVTLIGGGSGWLTSSASQARAGSGHVMLPQHLSGWALMSPASTWVINTKSQTQSLRLTYRRNGHNMQVRIIETLTPDAKLQESDLAPDDTGKWRDSGVKRAASCNAVGCLSFMHTTWQNADTDELQHVYATYAMGTLFTTSKFALRAAHGWDRLLRGHGVPRLIGFVLDSPEDVQAIDEFAPAFRAVLSALEAGSA
jgi:exosortase